MSIIVVNSWRNTFICTTGRMYPIHFPIRAESWDYDYVYVCPYTRRYELLQLRVPSRGNIYERKSHNLVWC